MSASSEVAWTEKDIWRSTMSEDCTKSTLSRYWVSSMKLDNDKPPIDV